MTDQRLSYGKIRRLSQCADRSGRFTMLAADQRGNLRRSINPDHPELVSDAEMIEFKVELMDALSGRATAVLLDPEFGAAQSIETGAVDPSTGLIVALEATGYEASPSDRRSKILPGWSPAKASDLGASAAKLLVYFHPDADSASAQIELVATTAEQCSAVELPLIVEPLSFSLGDAPLESMEKRDVVTRTAAVLGQVDGVDMLKMEFPATPQDPSDWVDACAELDGCIPVPWVILSAGVDFDTFLRQAEVACKAGASGVLAGRAVWKEAVPMSTSERADFYATIGAKRLDALADVVAAHGRPWRSAPATSSIASDWYVDG